jgi:hypothetical protein
MQTSDFIRAIAADARRPGMPMDRAWQLAVLAAVPFKFVVTLTLALCTLPLIRSLSTPGAAIASRFPLLLLAPALLAAAIAAELLFVPPAQWMARTIGTNNLFCLTFIPLIGAAPLAAFLAALRYGAPTRPALAGAVAGLLAGAVSASFYAAHCTDDSPLFVAVWYSLAIAVLAGIGALAAPRLLQW